MALHVWILDCSSGSTFHQQPTRWRDSRNVIPSYRWICPVCDVANAPAGACSRCGAPVRMSASEIQLAQTQGVAALYASREDAQRARADWMARPLWRRIGDVIFGTMFVVGLCLVRLTWGFAGSIRYVAVGCAALLLPVLWFVATRDRNNSG
jgi:hypothetical protein